MSVEFSNERILEKDQREVVPKYFDAIGEDDNKNSNFKSYTTLSIRSPNKLFEINVFII